MKKIAAALLLLSASLLPNLSYAKGVPLFFQTGDEIFEIEGAPQLEDGFSVGYACKHLGLFYADLWTWDCAIMAVNKEAFSVGELDQEFKSQIETKYNLSDRKRSPWNHYGAFAIAFVVAGGLVIKSRK
ncbi:hypothetical protein [Atopomonas hussainii]|uniref:hypothetical protein n=1 Tax=Atopomonas hussainii TaxID=1429083 RepID=UPI0009003332|nr:hypothetical protein [Atopomonas hussainii]